VACQKGRDKVLIFEFGKQRPKYTCTSPEKLTSCCIDLSGEYLFAGGKSGKIFCWKVRHDFGKACHFSVIIKSSF